MSDAVIMTKLARLGDGHPPRVLDLFSGCGGMTLGFHAAGFVSVGGVEIDAAAARSFGLNFHGGDPRHCTPRDITRARPASLAAELGLAGVDSSVDVIVGGPPCQAFARIGRPKLREIEAHPEAFRLDPRATLYREYLRHVDAFRPLAILMENVPDVLNHGGQNIAEDICEVLERRGYACGYTLLNASYYGVPQMRERMFLLAYRREVASSIAFPRPTHGIELPPGYASTRAVALRVLRDREIAGSGSRYISAAAPAGALPPAITASEAIGDLPAILARRELVAGTLKPSRRNMDPPRAWDGRRKVSPYALSMRTWPRFGAGEVLDDHKIRCLPRDHEIFARMKEGDQYPEAHEQAVRLLAERLSALRRRGVHVAPGSARFRQMWKETVPPYDPGKFPNKWRKLWSDQPARTLMAHLGRDGYSHIHYDGEQARTISVREAARLQSFPDGFQFAGSMNAAFRQIGNAVPPLMARSIAVTMIEQLRAGAGTAEDLRQAA